MATKIELRYAPIAHARDAVSDLIRDIKGRSGIGNEWDEIDEITQHEIADEWADLIEKHFLGSTVRADQEGE